MHSKPTWLAAARRRPGLFITATDTGVGKTVITCAIAAAIRRASQKDGAKPLHVGVCKPLATGCRMECQQLVSEDALALAHFADCCQPQEVICPIRFGPAMAPGVASEWTGEAVNWSSLDRALALLDRTCDLLLVEGVGGLLVPLEATASPATCRDLAQTLGYPVVVVVRATLGTLNHTAMTVELLRQAGCKLAGLVINGWDPDCSQLRSDEDRVMVTNRTWLSKMTGLPVLATVPLVRDQPVVPHEGRIPTAILEAVMLTDWLELTAVPD